MEDFNSYSLKLFTYAKEFVQEINKICKNAETRLINSVCSKCRYTFQSSESYCKVLFQSGSS